MEINALENIWAKRKQLSDPEFKLAQEIFNTYFADKAPRPVSITPFSKKVLNRVLFELSTPPPTNLFVDAKMDISTRLHKEQFGSYVKEALFLAYYNWIAFGEKFRIPNDVLTKMKESFWNDSDWKIFKRTSNYQIDEKSSTVLDTDTAATRGRAIVPISLPEIRTLIVSMEMRRLWDGKYFDFGKILEELNESTTILYFRYSISKLASVLVKNQDFVALRAENIDSDGVYYSNTTSVAHKAAPEVQGFDRGNVLFAGFTVKPIGDGKSCEVRYLTQGKLISVGTIEGAIKSYVVRQRGKVPRQIAKFVQKELEQAKNENRAPIWKKDAKYKDDLSFLKTSTQPNDMPTKHIIQREDMHLLENGLIEHGSFGNAHKVAWRAMDCVLKELSVSQSEKADLAHFFELVGLMRKLPPHKNVALFIGACRSPLALVTEYCEKGTLQSVLHSKELEITEPRQLAFMEQIARGLLHLSEEGIVHEDVSARNVVVNESYTCKLTDYGMAKFHDSNIPKFQWYAPEVILTKQFSSAGDVFSYAIMCLFEIMDGKLVPWPDCPDESLWKTQFPQYHEKLRTQDVQAICKMNSQLCKMLLNCLYQQPQKRIDFAGICSFFTSKITRLTSSELFGLATHSPNSSPKIPHTNNNNNNNNNNATQEHEYANLKIIKPPTQEIETNENDDGFRSNTIHPPNQQ